MTPQTRVVDDLFILVNAKLSALAETLMAQGLLQGTDFSRLLDKHKGPLTAQSFVAPLLDALLEHGALDAQSRAEILLAGEDPSSQGADV